MRAIIDGAQAGEPRARLALDVYIHRLRAGIAAMAASLGGIDALLFTGGVCERAPVIRSMAASGLGFLGVELDSERNESGPADRDIGADGARVRSLVIAAGEDREIAREVRTVLGLSPAASDASGKRG